MRIIFLILILIIIISIGYFIWSQSRVQYFKGSEKDKWISIATPLTEKLLKSIFLNDYYGYISICSEEHKQDISEEKFKSMREGLISQLGNYLSFTPEDVYLIDNIFITVSYTVKFEKKSAVKIRVIFNSDNVDNKVEGFFID